ncbi:MAG: alpha-hydroxy acid oxidase [Sphingomonadales bacterium]|mgnify:CR=1 FL=1
MGVAQCYNIADLRVLAKRRAHKMVFDYIDGGADDEVTLVRNSSDFAHYDLVHRALVGQRDIDLSCSLLGMELAVPFFCGPTAGNRLFHKHGERAVTRAAHAAGTACSLSTLASVSIEEVAALTPGPKIFQLYVWKDKGLVKEMLQRAKVAGFHAMALTVDLSVHGNRERDLYNGLTIPPTIRAKQVFQALTKPAWTYDFLTSQPIRYANFNREQKTESLMEFVGEQLDPNFSWRDAEAYRARWDGPAVLKGIVHPGDAKRAIECGYDAVAVSNHGGRQLDADISPITALPAIVECLGGSAPIILDGGIRRGTDIIKALCLGAAAVSFGRPYLYGLAAGGQAGVERALTLLTEELKRSMTLLGARSIKELTQEFLKQRDMP